MENSVSPVAAAMSRFDSLPEQIRDFLLSPEVKKRRLELAQKYSLTPDAHAALAKTRRDLYDKDIFISDFPAKASAALGKSLEAAKPLILEIVGYEFLPISDYLGDVEGLIKSLGGDPGFYPVQKITIREITPTEIITEVLHENPVNVPAYLEHRLREILESRVRNVRKDAETIQRLTRAEKIGGVEMDEAEAQGLVEHLVSKIAGIKIAPDAPAEITPTTTPSGFAGQAPTPSFPKRGEETTVSGEALSTEQVATNIPVNTQRAVLAAPVVRSADSDRRGDGFTSADAHEAEAIRARVLPNIMTQELFDLGREITNATDLITAAYGKNLTPELAARLKAVVESRLKGVRDAAETADLLSRPVTAGGVGLGPVLASALADELKKYDGDIHGQRDALLKKEKESFVKDGVAMSNAKDESRKSGQQEEMDRMYAALTGNKKKRATAPVVPSATVQPIVLDPPKPTTQSPYLYTPPAVPTTVSQQPTTRMRDIRPMMATARLTGPIEELKSITLTDFRRLSSDPAEACRKLLDKLDLLEDRSFGQRIEGVKAWRESEVYQLYLHIITASFSGGQKIPAIIAEAMANNQPTLTEHEVHAIMDMNRQLKA